MERFDDLWASDMVIVKELTEVSISETVADPIAQGESPTARRRRTSRPIATGTNRAEEGCRTAALRASVSDRPEIPGP
jgi:hypothetical protein